MEKPAGLRDALDETALPPEFAGIDRLEGATQLLQGRRISNPKLAGPRALEGAAESFHGRGYQTANLIATHPSQRESQSLQGRVEVGTVRVHGRSPRCSARPAGTA
jgi:hypothetical protein